MSHIQMHARVLLSWAEYSRLKEAAGESVKSQNHPVAAVSNHGQTGSGLSNLLCENMGVLESQTPTLNASDTVICSSVTKPQIGSILEKEKEEEEEEKKKKYKRDLVGAGVASGDTGPIPKTFYYLD